MHTSKMPFQKDINEYTYTVWSHISTVLEALMISTEVTHM